MSFEDRLMEEQADMVDICLEYVKNTADKIYIYCSGEDNFLFCNFFYQINGRMLRKHELDAIGNKMFDVSDEAQDRALSILMEDYLAIKKLCEDNKREFPTEIRLEYDVPKNHLDSYYRYGLNYSKNSKLSPGMIERAWFEQLKNKTH